MNEPRRWLDDHQTASELRDLLASASPPPPLPPGLNAQFSEYAAALAAQSVLAKVGGVSVWHKLVVFAGGTSKAVALVSLVGAMGAVGVGAYTVQRASTPSPRGEPPRTPAPAPVQARTPEPRLPMLTSAPASQVVSPQGAPSNAALGAASVERAHQLASPARDAELTPPAASSSESSIVGEAKLLGTARSFLDDSPALALDVTEQHRRKYPVGQLSAEREFVAIEALLRLGRRQEAERRAAPMLNGDSDGLYARRLRKLLSPAPSKSENH